MTFIYWNPMVKAFGKEKASFLSARDCLEWVDKLWFRCKTKAKQNKKTTTAEFLTVLGYWKALLSPCGFGEGPCPSERKTRSSFSLPCKLEGLQDPDNLVVVAHRWGGGQTSISPASQGSCSSLGQESGATELARAAVQSRSQSGNDLLMFQTAGTQ